MWNRGTATGLNSQKALPFLRALAMPLQLRERGAEIQACLPGLQKRRKRKTPKPVERTFVAVATLHFDLHIPSCQLGRRRDLWAAKVLLHH